MSEEAGKSGETAFTAGEHHLLITIMVHLKSDIEFDTDAVAAEMGYKDGQIAKDRWDQIKKNMIKSGTAATAAETVGASTDGRDGDGDDVEEVERPDWLVERPTKRARKTKWDVPPKGLEAAGASTDGRDGHGDDVEEVDRPDWLVKRPIKRVRKTKSDVPPKGLEPVGDEEDQAKTKIEKD